MPTSYERCLGQEGTLLLPSNTEDYGVNFKAHKTRNHEICDGEAIIVGTQC